MRPPRPRLCGKNIEHSMRPNHAPLPGKDPQDRGQCKPISTSPDGSHRQFLSGTADLCLPEGDKPHFLFYVVNAVDEGKGQFAKDRPS